MERRRKKKKKEEEEEEEEEEDRRQKKKKKTEDRIQKREEEKRRERRENNREEVEEREEDLELSLDEIAILDERRVIGILEHGVDCREERLSLVAHEVVGLLQLSFAHRVDDELNSRHDQLRQVHADKREEPLV